MGFEYVILVMQFLMLYIFWKTRTSRPVLPSPVNGALPSSISEHTLVRVWKKLDGEYDKRGWWWECSCGAKHPGSEVSSRYYGNEANALDTFKRHAKLYVEFAVEQTNPLEKELDKVKKDYAEYREKCYCKDTNDDLLIMKTEGKWD